MQILFHILYLHNLGSGSRKVIANSIEEAMNKVKTEVEKHWGEVTTHLISYEILEEKESRQLGLFEK